VFRSKIIGSYPGSFNENVRRFEQGSEVGARKLVNGGLRVLDTPAYFSCKFCAATL